MVWFKKRITFDGLCSNLDSEMLKDGIDAFYVLFCVQKLLYYAFLS